MKWPSIKVDVRFSLINSLRYLTFSAVRAVFGWPLPGFHSVADPRSTRFCFHWAMHPTLSRKFCNNCLVSKTKFPQCLDPSFTFVVCMIFTHNQSYRPNCDYDLKYWRTYYNALLLVNIKITTSQQRWYLLLGYFCEIRSWRREMPSLLP